MLTKIMSFALMCVCVFLKVKTTTLILLNQKLDLKCEETWLLITLYCLNFHINYSNLSLPLSRQIQLTSDRWKLFPEYPIWIWQRVKWEEVLWDEGKRREEKDKKKFTGTKRQENTKYGVGKGWMVEKQNQNKQNHLEESNER